MAEKKKKSWSTPALREMTAEQAVSLFMGKQAEATAKQQRLEQELAQVSQSLAESRDLLAKCQCKLGAIGSGPSAAEPANANGDYRPPYDPADHSRKKKGRSVIN